MILVVESFWLQLFRVFSRAVHVMLMSCSRFVMITSCHDMSRSCDVMTRSCDVKTRSCPCDLHVAALLVLLWLSLIIVPCCIDCYQTYICRSLVEADVGACVVCEVYFERCGFCWIGLFDCLPQRDCSLLTLRQIQSQSSRAVGQILSCDVHVYSCVCCFLLVVVVVIRRDKGG